MNLTDFNTYSTKLRAEIVQVRGLLLAQRTLKEYRIKLFAVKCFFVEIWVLEADQKQVIEVSGFKNIICLEPYLNMIKLPSL
ncbi:hypothetical protein [Adhaeribacter aquaticus]|uniref:hypothetical protein n=1 Tax=Adhaeribacter aquaticus TaxID=299567 RepID=UPI00047E84DB|nr:hypothetical protein [Adhaeribacter aquaticus]